MSLTQSRGSLQPWLVSSCLALFAAAAFHVGCGADSKSTVPGTSAQTGGATGSGGSGVSPSAGTAGVNSSPTGDAGSGQASVTAFVHPGALDAKAELDFVKGQIQAGAQPWTGEFDRIKGSIYATRAPNPLLNINSSGSDAATSRDDAMGAYLQALLWYYTDEETYAHRAIAILDAWSNLQGFNAGSDQDKLQAGWIGAVFAPAAEIMRGYPGWPAESITKLQAMFKRAFYPQLNVASAWNGNVDLTQIDAMMAIAVFNEDSAEFDAGIQRWHARVPSYFYLAATGAVPPIAGDGGNVNAFYSNPTAWIDGLTQETCRDNGHHAQFGLGSAIHAAEVAWHQGIDLYATESVRFSAVLELLATQLLTGDMQGTCANPTATADRYDTWEVAYNHYHNRIGIALPKTNELLLAQIRPKAHRADWNLVWETLTHADVN